MHAENKYGTTHYILHACHCLVFACAPGTQQQIVKRAVTKFATDSIVLGARVDSAAA